MMRVRRHVRTKAYTSAYINAYTNACTSACTAAPPRGRRRLRTVTLLLALVAGTGPARAGDLSELMDKLARQGDDTPQAAIVSLQELGSVHDNLHGPLHRLMLLDVGIIAAHNGEDALAREQIAALLALAPAEQPLAEADAHMIRAELEENAGHAEAAYDQVRAALQGYAPACEPGPRPRADCDARSWSRALQLAATGALGQGNVVVATRHAQTMLDAARRASDHAYEALALALLAMLSEANADSAAASRFLAHAQRVSRFDGAPWLDVRVTSLAGMLHQLRQQPEQALHDFEAALAAANGAGLKRSAMLLRINLSDAYIHAGRPAAALAAIELALPVAHRHHDRRAERLLLHNAALAHLALGRLAQAKVELPQVLELWQRDTGSGQRAEALREFGDALAKAGDAAGALEMFHREEALAREIRAANRASAESEVRARYDHDAQMRRIELLARDNQLKTVQLDNQMLTRRLWMLAGAGLLLGGVLAVLAYLSMRGLNRRLVGHAAQLRAHSERDALTGLANRRQLRELLRAQSRDRVFQGALLMVDVDHFKRINDQHGHAAGDRVLVEVARRLAAMVHAQDLVTRWGGEEFLIFAPRARGAELDELAERLRSAVQDAPVVLGEGRAEITVSIGYAAFPLPGEHLPVTWEQAVNLADLSLYSAKKQGRNCAVGLVGTTAASGQALREVEADLERARREGRVTLKILNDAPQPAEHR